MTIVRDGDGVAAIQDLFGFAGVRVQCPYQSGQSALIEFVLAQMRPFLALGAIAVDQFAHLAKVFFGMKPVEDLHGLGGDSSAVVFQIQAAPSASTT